MFFYLSVRNQIGNNEIVNITFYYEKNGLKIHNTSSKIQSIPPTWA